MRYLYTIIFYIALPFIILRALWRTRKSDNFFQRLSERIGFYDFPALNSSIWLHAVSYGEAVAAEPLLRQLKSAYPSSKIVITTMTYTGAVRITATWNDDCQIQHVYIPYDIPFAIDRFLDHVKPLVAIIMETELWPNLLHVAGKRQLPVIVANARLSPRSLDGYLKIKKFMAPFIRNISCVAAQTEADAERFKSLGALEKQVAVLGNLKFDITPPCLQIENGKKLKGNWSYDNIIVAASTHHNEEEQLLDIYSELQTNFPNTLLIIVPRHPERFEEVASICIKKGYKVVRRSDNVSPQGDKTVFLGDTMGEMYLFYSLADIAFVGGSLVPVGGHNLLEPAALKLPIITGQHLHNFTAISKLLTETRTLHVGSSKEELLEILKRLLNDHLYQREVGEAGFRIFAQNRGATERHLAAIAKLLPK